MKMGQLHGDALLMEEKAPIQPRYESKARASETRVCTNARKGDQDEIEQGDTPKPRDHHM